MANHPLTEAENRNSFQAGEARLGARLSPDRGRRIIHRQLGQLSDHLFLSETDVAQLSRRLMARRYTAGEVILREGVHGDCLGLVTRGQVAVYPYLAHRGKPRALLLPGSTFGEAMLTNGRPCGSTLRAATDADVLFLRRADFLAVTQQRQLRPEMRSWLQWLMMLGLVLLVGSVLLVLTPTRRAVALVPYSIGLWFGQQGRADWAEATWLLSQRLAPDWAMSHLILGNLYLRQGQFEQARTQIEQALALIPDLAEAHNSLGLLYVAQGDPEAASAAFQQALALEPGQATVEGNLAFSLQLAGQGDEALRHYALARSMDASGPALLTNEAIAQYQAGRLDAAALAARQALDLDAASAPAYAVLGAVDLVGRHPKAAVLSLEQAVRLDPAYSLAHFYLGLAYKSMGQWAQATIAFESALALTTDPVAQREARRHLGELYARGGTDAGRYPPALAGERR